MGLKDKVAERMLGSVTNKAMKGLVPLMESIHTYMELQAAYLEEILRIQIKNKETKNEEEINAKIKTIRDRIVEE